MARRAEWLPALLLLAITTGCESSRIRAERAQNTLDRVHAHVSPGMLGKARRPVEECEPGQLRTCGPEWAYPVARGVADAEALRPKMTCRRFPDGHLRFDRSDCATPLVVAWDDAPVTFEAPRAEAASFAVGPYASTEWPRADAPWLALDRDGSGCIEDQSELFAGFAALAALDANGDGVVDPRDPAFAELVLWSDADGDRRCTPGELTSFQDAGILALPVDGVPPPTERLGGSHEGERAAVRTRDRRARLVDVYVAPIDPEAAGGR